MPVNLLAIIQMLMMSAAKGQIPAELHCNQVTHDSIIESIKLAGAVPVTSRWRLFLNWIFRVPKQPWKINGVPLIVDSLMTDGAVLCRPLHLIGKENWIEILAADGLRDFLRCQASEVGMVEHHPSPDLQNAAVETMSRTAGKSVTDILIDATTNCDDVRTVVVITVKQNNEVCIRGNADRFGMSGLLNAVLNTMEGGE